MRVLFFIGCLFIFDSLLRFALLCLRAVLPARKTSSGNASEAGCVVLIAARDEAGTIGPTVAELKKHLVEWPNSSLWVIADCCLDATAEDAATAGAEVAIRSEGKLGKGAVIAWWIRHHSHIWQAKDAIVILDADSRIAKGSLSNLRQAMIGKAEVAQMFVAPDAETASGRLAGWSEVLMQRIDDEARWRSGWSVPLRGTGMAFRCDLLAELVPRLHTYAEDLELDVILASRGLRVAFVPQAKVFDPKPQQASGASRQRARWLQGQLQVLKDYLPEFTKALLIGGANAWFLLWLLILRPKMLFIAARVLLLFAGWFYLPVLWLAFLGLAMDFAYYLAGVAIVDNPRRYLLDLLAVPRYAAMWGFSFGTALLRRRVWLRAGR